MKRSISSLLPTAAILLCSSFAAHAESLGTFACTSGANTVSMNVGYFNLGVSESPLESLLTAGKASGNILEIHVALRHFQSLLPLAQKTTTLRACTLSATLPSGLNVQYAFNAVTIQSVNAVAHGPRVASGEEAGGHTDIIATFNGLSDQSTGGADDGGSGDGSGSGSGTATPPPPKS